MKTAEIILSETLARYKPSLIVCSYSGGYDSMIATHKALRWAKQNAHSTNVLTVAVDTLIHADGWLEYVKQSAKTIGARRFEICETTMLNKWIADVGAHGFAYSRAQHKIYFYYLKQNAFRAVVAHYKKHKSDRIMFITGVRRAESKERADTPESERIGSNVWCNPLVNWSEQDVHEYRIEHDLPENPFYNLTNNSGDCLCNWHREIPLKAVTGKAFVVISALDSVSRERFGYGYGEKPSKAMKQEIAGQLPLDFSETPYLCAGCEREKPSQDQLESVLLQRMKWD